MLRYAVAVAVLAAAMSSTECFAVTAKQKMATCKFGADDQKLQGAARKSFLKKCMADTDESRGAAGAPPPPRASAVARPPSPH